MAQQFSIDHLIQQEVTQLTSVIKANLNSDVSLVNDVANYIFKNGGKQLRPKLLLTIAKVFDVNIGDKLIASHRSHQEVDKHIILAAVVEFIHVATLLHDDVVDESAVRRGQKSANAHFSNAASVLVGDYLYTRAFQMMLLVNNSAILNLLADTTNTIAEGEVLQLMNTGNICLTEEDYFQVIHSKTTSLFVAATKIAGIVSEVDELTLETLGEYGKNLGTAFQLIDDMLDYVADETVLGKSLGDDLREGKFTLPLIYGYVAADKSQQQFINSIIEAPEQLNDKKLSKLTQLLIDLGAINKTYLKAKQYIEKAIENCRQLPQNQYTDALIAIAKNSLTRQC